jgi:uncharacterized membrane protein YphA (DoxX/SURF4 family)
MTTDVSQAARRGFGLERGVSLILRLGFAVLFAFAGLAKLQDPTKFALEISNYQLFAEKAPLVAAALPTLELFLAVALLVLPRPKWRTAAALAVLVVMVMFLGAVGWAFFNDINIDCGCFGGGEGPIDGWTVLRNVALSGLAGLLLWIEWRAAHSKRTTSFEV